MYQVTKPVPEIGDERQFTFVKGPPELLFNIIDGTFLVEKSRWFVFLTGPKGEQGDPLTWDDLSTLQKASLKGEQGNQGESAVPFTWDDLTDEQKLQLKGDALLWQDLTEDQKLELKGEPGTTPEFGVDYFNGLSAFEVWQAIPGNELKTEEEYLASLKGSSVSEGERYSSTSAGTVGEMSVSDDYLYICVASGIAGSARWKKTILFLSE